MCDELTRTGNLFLLVTTDAAGMSYIRAVPATDIDVIDARQNDIEQPLSFRSKADPVTMEKYLYPAYDENTDAGGPVMLHYAINRPVGGQWGESDLAPLLKWLSRYTSWLDDRARLNRYRTAFLYVVKAKFTSEAERLARQTVLAATPPPPGSIMVTDDTEEWTVIEPKLESGDANTDGLALKKMIAAGSGIPLHFLAEPESATRTTAEAAGGPTYRHFEQRQEYFCWMLSDLLRVVINRRRMFDRHIAKTAHVDVRGADISARDNVSLSMAASNITNALGALFDRGLLDQAEYLRLVYRFAGEFFDIEDMTGPKKGDGRFPAKSPPGGATIGTLPSPIKAPQTRPVGSDIDPETGEPRQG